MMIHIRLHNVISRKPILCSDLALSLHLNFTLLTALGDGLLDSLCSPVDMQTLLVGGVTASSPTSPLAGLFAISFPPHSPPVMHRESLICYDEESSDELQLLERETLGGRTVRLTQQQKKQLTLESTLLSTLLALLKGKSAFKSFTASQLAHHTSGSRSRGRLINMLCRRLILTVSEGDADIRDSGMLDGDSVDSGKPFNMLNIKLQVRYYFIFDVQ
jgi:hypothetical protein